MKFENWTIDELFERCIDIEDGSVFMNSDEVAALRRKIAELRSAQPVSSGYKLPPHVYRDLVNSLRDTAVQFSGTEQLRERLNTTLHQFIEPDHHHTRTVAPEGGN